MNLQMPGSDPQRSSVIFTRSTPAGGQPNTEQGDLSGASIGAVESLLDAHASFEGRLRAEQDLRIQGSIAGDISCRGLLTIDATAIVRAEVEANDMTVYGTVEGNINCSGRLWLGSTAVVTGAVKAGSLAVDQGASFNGSMEANYSGVAVAESRPSRGSLRAGKGDGPALPSFAMVRAVEAKADVP